MAKQDPLIESLRYILTRFNFAFPVVMGVGVGVYGCMCACVCWDE